MRLLVDSNVLFWTVSDPQQSTRTVRRVFEDEGNELFVSHVSLWELSVKLVRGRMPVSDRSIHMILQATNELGITILPIELADILGTEMLPHHHSDPFDRLIIAQAIRRDLTILTSDGDIPLYPVPVIWK